MNVCGGMADTEIGRIETRIKKAEFAAQPIPHLCQSTEQRPSKRPSLFHYNAPATLTFALLALAVFGLSYLTNNQSDYYLSVSRDIRANPLLSYRLLTHILVHQDFSHYLANFSLILLLGPILEEKYGSARMALMISFVSVATGIFHILFYSAPLIGASAVLFMMILLVSFANKTSGRIGLSVILVLALYIIPELLALRDFGSISHNAHHAHLVGGITGAIFGILIGCHQKNSKPYLEATSNSECCHFTSNHQIKTKLTPPNKLSNYKPTSVHIASMPILQNYHIDTESEVVDAEVIE